MGRAAGRVGLLLAMLVPMTSAVYAAPAAQATTADPNYEVFELVGGDAFVPADIKADEASVGACQSPNKSEWDGFFIGAENVLGWMLWKFTMYAHKCWKPLNGLSYFKVFTKGETAGWTPWTYDGVVNSINNGYPADNSFAYRYRQAKFHYCIGPVCLNKYPWLSVRAVAGSGAPTWSWKKGGGD